MQGISQIYYSPSKTCHRGPFSNSGQDCGYPDINFYIPSKKRKGFCPKLNFIFQFIIISFMCRLKGSLILYSVGTEMFFTKDKSAVN